MRICKTVVNLDRRVDTREERRVQLIQEEIGIGRVSNAVSEVHVQY